ncbi:IS30 family transposase [Gemmiger sp. An50]|uniref:IS30 family transposase n=1 Tax=Gemmiger sp. An50 TaxID=1965639 RepID=UPI0019D0D817|nr:IS30 family transposase [Gemmiger sp. An50]
MSEGTGLAVIQNAWPTVCSFEWMLEAHRHACKGKRYRLEVMGFTSKLEKNLLDVQERMKDGSYELGPYRKMWVFVPKKRLVMALDYPDRIVQWCLYLYLNPIYDKLFIEDSYACRKGKGSHKAAKRLQYWMQQVSRKPGPGWYCLKLDISKYFYRVNHDKLLEILSRRIADQEMMEFVRGVVNSKAEPFGLPRWRSPDDTPPEEWEYETGMPIGNLTSQLFANIYLNELDQYCKHKYQAQLREKGPDLKIGKDHELAEYIEQTIIERDCSPAAVLGYAMMEGKTFKTTVSVQTIYKYIKMGLFLHITQVDLPRRGKRKNSYKKVKTNKSQARASAGESIENRAPEVKNRKEFGHWEMDTVYSKKNTTAKALLVLTERKTRKEIIIGVPNRKAETIVRALDALERKMGAAKFRKIFKSITVDNGSEFAAAEAMERSAINKTIPRTAVYFCHPYSSWERGSNENNNIMIRRKHPKGTDFSKVSAAQIKETENWINNYPRKILGYKSSEAVFRECLRELGIVA